MLKAITFLLLPMGVLGQWQSTNGPHGAADIKDLLVTDSVVLASTLYGTFCSTDSGMHWVPVLTDVFVRDALFQERIYVANGDLKRLVPLAGQWSAEAVNAGGTVIDVCAATELMVASGYGGFLYSHNGQDWITNNEGLPVETTWIPGGTVIHYVKATALAYDATFHYVGTGHGVFRSLASNLPWEPASMGLPDNTVDLLESNGAELMAAMGQELYRSVDAGSSWALIHELGVEDDFQRLAFLEGTWYACTRNAGLLASADGGLTWVPAGTGLGEDDVRDIVQVGTARLVGTARTVYAGTTVWAPQDEGLNTCIVHDLASTGGTMVATELYGAHVRADGSDTWVRSTEDLSVGAMWSAAVLNDGYLISVIPDALGAAFCTNYSASASGLDWQPVSTLTNYGDPWALRSDGERVLAYTDDILLLSVNGASTWQDISPPAGMVCNNFSDVGWYGDTIFLVACSSYDVLRSTDLGATWNYATNGLPDAEPYHIQALSTGLFVATMQGLYRSLDGGDSWVFAGGGLPEYGSVDPSGYVLDMVAATPYTFLCTNNVVFVSDAAHEHWTAITDGLPPRSNLWGGALLLKDDTLYHGTNGWGVYKRGLNEIALAVPGSSIEEVLTLWPNPAVDEIHLDIGRLRSLEAVDASGRVVSLPMLGGGRYAVGALGPGLYTLRAVLPDGTRRMGRVVIPLIPFGKDLDHTACLTATPDPLSVEDYLSGPWTAYDRTR